MTPADEPRADPAASDTTPGDATLDDTRLGDAGRVVAVTAAGSEFGLPVEAVQEVVRIPPVTRLPFPPPTIRGVASVRGEVVTVMDLGMRLLGRSSSPERRLVVVRDPGTGEKVGLLVEHVAGLVQDRLEADAPPEAIASLPDGWISRVVTPSEDRVVTVLDLEAVLALDHALPTEPR